MNLQPSAQPRSSNGFGRRRVDREIGAKSDSKVHGVKSASRNFGDSANGGKLGALANPSRDRLVYVTTYLIGLHVDVHVRNGSIISGIFHAINPEKDFAVVLKMAQVVKDGSVKGQKPVPETIKKPMDMIIQAKDLVQIVAKDVALDIKEFSDAYPRERRKDLMIDSAISHSLHLEGERELERWTPDIDDPECPELEDIFDGTWNRTWDQFETNKALFGVKSTFDEELYTTKLERGPRTRELEREATRIAREIEGEETHDLHLAEERGIHFDEEFDLDEEIKYSAVRREIDDSTFQESQNSVIDAYNTETFGTSHGSAIPKPFSDSSRSKFIDEAQTSSTSSSVDAEISASIHSGVDASSNDNAVVSTDNSIKKSHMNRLGEKQIKLQDKEKNILSDWTDRTASEKVQRSQDKDLRSSADAKDPSSSVVEYDPSSSSRDSKHSSTDASELTPAVNESTHTSLRSSALSTAERLAHSSVSSGPGLSPSSSLGSLSSEKSTLNPNAKEFKLNPNAKSFTPTSFRPPVPISEGAFYYASSLPAVPPMHSVPMGIGIGPSFGGHQPVFNSQSAPMQSPQAYIHPNGPMYGQQVILGQPRPLYYMPAYPPDIPYKGRNF